MRVKGSNIDEWFILIEGDEYVWGVIFRKSIGFPTNALMLKIT